MLRESKFQQRSQVLSVGKWRVVLEEKMMMYKNKHYYVRVDGLLDMFDKAIGKIFARWCDKLGLNGDILGPGFEVMDLDDRTPIGPMDSLLVAEAVINNRTPPSIIDIEDPSARNDLRQVDYGLDTFDQVGLDMSLDMSKGTLMGTPIGLAQMKEIYDKNSNE
jgi:hypothetical protein